MSRYLKFVARKLEELSDIGLRPNQLKSYIDIRKQNIHYSRYKLYDKKWLRDSNINTVIDIGANVGEFTKIFSIIFSGATIHAFEPLPECFSQLKKTFRNMDNINLYQMALGSQAGKSIFNVSSWKPSSSFRAMLNKHKEIYPYSADISNIEVDVVKLDDVLKKTMMLPNILIKIDVQGFEDEVLKGGENALNIAKVVVIECSFQAVYADEPMFDGIYNLLKDKGYSYVGSLKQSKNTNDDSYVQADCIFINNNIA